MEGSVVYMRRRNCERCKQPKSRNGPRDIIISIANNPVQSVMFTVIMTILGIVVVLGGICIWPYLFGEAFAGGGLDLATSFGKFVLLGGISGLLGLAVSIYFCWFYEWDEGLMFSFCRIWVIVYMVEIVANWMLMPILGIDMLAVASADVWSGILSVLLHGILGMLLAVSPSFIATLIGYLINVLWYVTHKHLL